MFGHAHMHDKTGTPLAAGFDLCVYIFTLHTYAELIYENLHFLHGQWNSCSTASSHLIYWLLTTNHIMADFLYLDIELQDLKALNQVLEG